MAWAKYRARRAWIDEERERVTAAITASEDQDASVARFREMAAQIRLLLTEHTTFSEWRTYLRQLGVRVSVGKKVTLYVADGALPAMPEAAQAVRSTTEA